MKTMKKGGISSNELVQRITRWAGMLVPAVVAIYILGVTNGSLPNFGYDPNAYVPISIAIAWTVAAVVQFIFFSTSQLNVFLRLFVFHALAVITIIFFTGFANFPLIFCWGILSAVVYIHYFAKGVWINLGILWASALLDALLHSEVNAILSANLSTAFSISLVIGIFILFFRVQERDDSELLASKKTERLERERLSTVMNNIADGVISLNRAGNIEIYNAATLNLLDTNASIQGSPIDRVINLEDEHGSPVPLLPILMKSKAITVTEDYFITTGDERTRLELTYSPIRSSYDAMLNSAKNDGYVVIFRDITKSKSLEEERDEFISVVSHELRTPIAITEGAIDNARIIFTRPGSKKAVIEKTLEMAHEQVIFLSKMVNDLSTLSRAERGVGDEEEAIDVTDIAKSLLEDYEPEATKKNLSFNLSLHGKLGTVKTSRLYLHELLQNFITNSIKYTKEGQIDLNVTVHNGVVNFAVADTGIGISKKDQEKVFHKFYRSEDYRTRETGGTGLGLYVAQKLARKMNTTIHIKSRLNHGSTFSFELPLYTEQTARQR